MSYNFTEDEAHVRRILFTPLKTIDELSDWLVVFLGIELPGVQVDPDSNCSPLQMVWETYSAILYGRDDEATQFCYVASRFSGKTLSQSIVEVLLLLHFRGNVCHLASIEEQSKNCQNYLKNWFMSPQLRGFVEGDNKRETSTVFFVPNNGGVNLSKAEFKTLSWAEQQEYKQVINKVEVIVATRQSVNGKHSILLCLDELDLLERPNVISEAVNIPTPCYREDGTVALPITSYTSTRKSSFGPVQHLLDNAEKTGTKVRKFNILDITEACPQSRHRPDLPKLTVYRNDDLLSAVTEEKYLTLPKKDQEGYVKDTCYHGCLNNCKLYAPCRGHLATRQTSTSKFLKPLSYVTNQFRVNTTENAISQLLCRKPSAEGLVYSRLDKDRHLLTPAQVYEKVTGEPCVNALFTKEQLISFVRDKGEWYAGIDHGFSHFFSFVMGISVNNVMYVTHAFAASELEVSQQVEAIEPYKGFDPVVFADVEDPASNLTFKRGGWRIKKWKKGPGSIVGGISVVRRKLSPTLGRDPELYFVKDVSLDPHMDLLFKHLSEHHWALDAAGKPTANVSDTNKDLPDALRYMVMNVYSEKGQFAVSEDAEDKPKILSHEGQPVYNAETWMTQRISELTGNEIRPVQTTRPPMTIEEIGHSYYGKVNEEEKKTRKGKSRGISWNFD